MTYATEGQAARSLFAAQWLDTPIAWPNVPFDPTRESGDPDGDALDPLEPWVRFSILPADAAIASSGSAGNRRYRHTGLVAVQVFVPEGEGDGRARDLVDQVCGIFRSVTADGVTYETPYVTDGGISNGWYGLTVWVPFRRDSFF